MKILTQKLKRVSVACRLNSLATVVEAVPQDKGWAQEMMAGMLGSYVETTLTSMPGIRCYASFPHDTTRRWTSDVVEEESTHPSKCALRVFGFNADVGVVLEQVHGLMK